MKKIFDFFRTNNIFKRMFSFKKKEKFDKGGVIEVLPKKNVNTYDDVYINSKAYKIYVDEKVSDEKLDFINQHRKYLNDNMLIEYIELMLNKGYTNKYIANCLDVTINKVGKLIYRNKITPLLSIYISTLHDLDILEVIHRSTDSPTTKPSVCRKFMREYIKRHIDDLGMNYSKMGRILGVSHTTISNITKNINNNEEN